MASKASDTYAPSRTSSVKVSIIMGSKSDLAIMSEAKEALDLLKVNCEMKVVSAHRTPKEMLDFSVEASNRGIEIIIAGAGGAAHLPGMVAALCDLPVIGVPIRSPNSLLGIDSLLSIVQMPKGVPVATVAVNGAFNAGVLAAKILALLDHDLRQRLSAFREELREKSLASDI